MTVSYNQDITNSHSLTFLRIIFRWKGSLWKSVLHEVALWTACYYLVQTLYRYLLPNEFQVEFEHIAKYMDAKMDYIPLTFMLGFFVTFVVDRWKQIFANIGFVDSFALFVSTYIRGQNQESRILRRNLVRYVCLTQVLVLRDISIRVRKRFPTTESLMDAGLLQVCNFSDDNFSENAFKLPNPFSNHEHMLMEQNQNGFPKYWMPIHWIFSLCQDMHERGHLSGGAYDNILCEARKFREQLQSLLNYDWVPVPLAYPQVVLMSTRIYFLLCLFTRQFRIHEQLDAHIYLEYYVPVMTMLQLVCVMGWLKVAETILNPMGEDDDDFECNYIIDRNLAVGMTMADECYGQQPQQHQDSIGIEGQRAMYSEKTANETQNPLVGSATLMDHRLPEEGEHVKMVERKPTVCDWSSEQGRVRKGSRFARALRKTFVASGRGRRRSEPAIHPVPHMPKSASSNGFFGDSFPSRFASSEGGGTNDLAGHRLRNGAKYSLPSPPNQQQLQFHEGTGLSVTNLPCPSPSAAERQQQFHQLERVSEEDLATVSTLDSEEMANLGLDAADFKRAKRKKKGEEQEPEENNNDNDNSRA